MIHKRQTEGRTEGARETVTQTRSQEQDYRKEGKKKRSVADANECTQGMSKTKVRHIKLIITELFTVPRAELPFVRFCSPPVLRHRLDWDAFLVYLTYPAALDRSS